MDTQIFFLIFCLLAGPSFHGPAPLGIPCVLAAAPPVAALQDEQTVLRENTIIIYCDIVTKCTQNKLKHSTIVGPINIFPTQQSPPIKKLYIQTWYALSGHMDILAHRISS